MNFLDQVFLPDNLLVNTLVVYFIQKDILEKHVFEKVVNFIKANVINFGKKENLGRTDILCLFYMDLAQVGVSIIGINFKIVEGKEIYKNIDLGIKREEIKGVVSIFFKEEQDEFMFYLCQVKNDVNILCSKYLLQVDKKNKNN